MIWVPSRTITSILAGLPCSWQGRSCARFGTQAEHADHSSQACDDDAEDPGCDPGERGAGPGRGGALRFLRADRLEMEQAGQFPGPESYGAKAPDHADAGARGGGGVQGPSTASGHAQLGRRIDQNRRSLRVKRPCQTVRGSKSAKPKR